MTHVPVPRAHASAAPGRAGLCRAEKGGRGRLWLPLAVAAALGLAIVLPPRGVSFANDSASPYRLWAQDRVRVTVYEWRPSKDEIFEWKPINAEYTVQPNGNVSVPLIGEVRAAGLTAAELAQSIGSMIRDRTGLAQSPDVSAEIVQYRPIYVTGQVDKPGEFSYRPNLMVLQAVALAGSLRRPPAGTRVERDIISGRSDLQHQAATYNALLARKARFEAEIADKPDIEFPAELVGKLEDRSIVALLQSERSLFEARRSANQNQINMLNDLKKYLQAEVESITGQLAAQTRQIDLVKKELEGINALMAKGLSIEPRRLGLERNIAQLEGERLRLDSNMTKARQEISRTGVSILELSTKREIEAANGLSETQIKLDEVARKFEATKGLLREAESTAPLVLSDVRGQRIKPVYTIVRVGANGIATEIVAAETTPVEPGDTIKVEVMADEKSLGPVPAATGAPRGDGKHPS